MGYKLNCGIELTECETGDSFIFDGYPHKLHYMGGRTHFEIGLKRQYMICQDGKEWDISKLTPTEETRRKVAGRNQPKFKFGYVIPVMEIGPARSVDFGEPWEASADTLGIPLRYLFGLDCEKPRDEPEPLARIIDWRGGEEVKPLDFVMLSSQYEDYRAVVMEVISPNEVRTCRGMVTLDRPTIGGSKFQIIRINTAAIPKQRTMTKAEVEREFGIKVSD